MVSTRRVADDYAGWMLLSEAHAELMKQGMNDRAATRRLDILMRTARSWGLMRIAVFLLHEIVLRDRMTMNEARRICGWRNA